ncbi:uncharacterized protein LOC127002115 [Eriocheir sinensis]|uniref:uncharacterized protein LOC127002115 n=1 Tax=Eriocheir sinensis TaxID=95602 RepID=UPI0021C5A956|nr:uncharacterized protein LOC127002115 [Eriocheir sinensis]
MKVLVCSSLVLAVLLVLAAGDEQGENCEPSFWGMLTRRILHMCPSEDVQACHDNSNKCFEELMANKLMVESQDDANQAKAIVMKCGGDLNVDVDFSPLSIKCFQKFPLTCFGVNVWKLLTDYEVPEDQVASMYKCVLSTRLEALEKCLTSTN